MHNSSCLTFLGYPCGSVSGSSVVVNEVNKPPRYVPKEYHIIFVAKYSSLVRHTVVVTVLAGRLPSSTALASRKLRAAEIKTWLHRIP